MSTAMCRAQPAASGRLPGCHEKTPLLSPVRPCADPDAPSSASSQGSSRCSRIADPDARPRPANPSAPPPPAAPAATKEAPARAPGGLWRVLVLAVAIGFLLGAGQVASIQFMLRKVCQQYYLDVPTVGEENTCQTPAVQAEIAKWTTESTLVQFVPVIVTSSCVGAISDSYGRKPVILTMLLGGAVLFANAALIDAFGLNVRWLTANMALSAVLGEGSLLGQLQASVSDLTEREGNRATAFGNLQAAVLAGAVSGSFTSGILADRTSIRTVFICTSVLAVLTFLYVLFFMRETAHSAGNAKITEPDGFKEQTKRMVAPLDLLLRTRTLRLFSVAYIFQCLIVCTYDQFGIIYATYRWSWAAVETGALYSSQYIAKMIVVVVGLPLVLKVAERVYRSPAVDEQRQLRGCRFPAYSGDVEVVAAGCAETPRNRESYQPPPESGCGLSSRPGRAGPLGEEAAAEPDCSVELFVVRFSWVCAIAAYAAIGLARTSREFFGACLLATITDISKAPLRSLFSSRAPAAQQATLFSALGLIAQLTDLSAPFAIQTVYPVGVRTGCPQALYFVLAAGMFGSLVFTLRAVGAAAAASRLRPDPRVQV